MARVIKKYEHPLWGRIEIFDAKNDETQPYGRFYAWQRNSYPPMFITKECKSLGKCIQNIVQEIIEDTKKEAQRDKKHSKTLLAILPKDTTIPGSVSYLSNYEIKINL
jgi:hypothetical protein